MLGRTYAVVENSEFSNKFRPQPFDMLDSQTSISAFVAAYRRLFTEYHLTAPELQYILKENKARMLSDMFEAGYNYIAIVFWLSERLYKGIRIGEDGGFMAAKIAFIEKCVQQMTQNMIDDQNSKLRTECKNMKFCVCTEEDIDRGTGRHRVVLKIHSNVDRMAYDKLVLDYIFSSAELQFLHSSRRRVCIDLQDTDHASVSHETYLLAKKHVLDLLGARHSRGWGIAKYTFLYQ